MTKEEKIIFIWDKKRKHELGRVKSLVKRKGKGKGMISVDPNKDPKIILTDLPLFLNSYFQWLRFKMC